MREQISPVIALIALLIVVSGAQPKADAGDRALALGRSFGSFLEGVDSAVQEQLDNRAEIRQSVNRAIDSVADFGVGLATPDASPEQRQLCRDALQLGFNPSELETEAALQRIGAWAENGMHEYPDRPGMSKVTAATPLSPAFEAAEEVPLAVRPLPEAAVGRPKRISQKDIIRRLIGISGR
ncbi:MAG: hypothetical protein HYV63_08720 [Candidatus Schekmanbacteria bacterium]|nr:hypothetical protein [Candidatus Schekmanbacteria bacterium]